MKAYLVPTLVAALTVAGAASAQTMATVATDLNVRSGPGVQHGVIGAIGAGDEVTVLGCIDSATGARSAVTVWKAGPMATI